MVPEGSIRVFLDTNVLFSGMYASSGPPSYLLDAAAIGRFRAVISRMVIEELVRNLRTKAPAALPTLERVFSEATFDVAPEPPPEAIEALLRGGLGSDAPVVAAASLGDVDYFCTGDQHLLGKLRHLERLDLRAVTPGQLVDLLQ